MLVEIYDTEGTGLGEDARIIQHAVAIYDTSIMRVIDSRSILCWEEGFNVAETKQWHGWEADTLRSYGSFPVLALRELDTLYRRYKPEAVIAHNADYDRRMLRQELARTVRLDPSDFGMIDLPWLCTVDHMEYPRCPSKNLLTLTAFHGFLNPLAHDALFDCFSLSKIISSRPTFVQELAENAAETYSLVFANIPLKFSAENNAMVKSKGFKFQEIDGHFYEKSWIKIIKRKEFNAFQKECAPLFQVSIIKDIVPENCYVELARRFHES